MKISPAKGKGPLTVPANGSVLIGGEGNASAVIETGDEPARNGDAQRVVFQFSETGDVALDALVVPANGPFTGFGPSASPSSSPSTGPSEQPAGTPSGTPSDGASGAPGDGATDGAADGESETPPGGTAEGADQGTAEGEQSTPTDSASASTNTEH